MDGEDGVSDAVRPVEMQMEQAASDDAISPTAFNDEPRLARSFMVFASNESLLFKAPVLLSSMISSAHTTVERMCRAGIVLRAATRVAVVAAVAMLLPMANAGAETMATTRTASPQSSRTLASSLLPAVKLSSDLGRMPPSTPMQHMALHFALTAAQQTDLTTLMHSLQEPSSPQFHKWLTPAQFQQRFGRPAEDVTTAEAWLRSQGFKIESAGPESVRFSGSVSQVESAFHIQMHNYALGKRHYFANSTAVALPESLTAMVRALGHLNSLRPTPLHRTRASVELRPNLTAKDGTHYTVPADVQTIYDVNAIYTAGYTGAGQTVAVVGQSLIDPADISLFHTSFGGSANLIMTLVPFTGDNSITSADDEGESDLDIEYSGSIAKNATVDFVYVGNDGSSDVFDAMQYAIQNAIAPIISISYGACETMYGQNDADMYGFFMDQAAIQGQTLIAASGDAGATACDANSSEAFEGLTVQFPSDSSDVTGVGGTEFNEGTGTYWTSTNGAGEGSAISYIPEMVWNDTATSPSLAASGGGASTIFTKPDWQIGTGVPSDGARDIPDIALDASNEHDPYFYCGAPDENGNNCADGYVYVAGGTSFAAPIFAGITTLINEATASTGQGNLNPILYPLASSAPSAFHDITVGNNDSPCISGSTDCPSGTTEIGYSAGVGYDPATGLGSIDGLLLAKTFPGYGTGKSLAGSNTALSYTPAAPDAGSTITFTATVASASASATVSGSVQLLIDGVPTGDTVSLSGGTASFSSTALTAGLHIVVAQYMGSDTVGGSAASAVLQIAALPATSTVVTIAPLVPTTGTPIIVTTLTSSATAGTPTGTVDLSVDGNDTNNPVAIASGKTVVTLPALTAGAHTITAQYSGDTSFAGSSGLSAFNVEALSGSSVSVSIAPGTPSKTDSVTATATVTAGATGTVQFLLDGTAAGKPVTVANGTAQSVLGMLAAGSHTLTAQYSGDSAFTASNGQDSFVVSSTAAAFTLSATSVNMGQNGSASSTVTIASTSDYAGTVQLAVSGSGPANACFLVNGNPTVAAHGTATALVSVYTGSACTTVQSAARARQTASAERPAAGLGLTGKGGVSLAVVGLAGLLLLGLRRQSATRWMVVLVAVAGLGILSGCGGSSKSTTTTTPPGAATGTYTLTVTGTDATSSSNTATTSLTLTVQ
jgi:subtilase family serine protease